MSTVAKHDAVGLGHVLGRGLEVTKTVGRAIAKSLGGAMRTMQMARMMQVLSCMTNEELARIGITRQQIPAFAEKLVNESD